MSNKISQNNCMQGFKDYVIQKRWVALSLLITNLVVLGGLIALGTVGHTGGLATIIGGGAAPTIGILASTILLINRGRSPLHRAIKNKAPIEQLLQGGDINVPDHSGNRPLHYAALNKHALDTLLTSEEIDVNVRNHSGYTPLQLAIRAGNKEVVEQLLQHSKIHIDTGTIAWAIGKGSGEIVMLLLEHDRIDGEWREPLLKAIDEGDLISTYTILDKYPDPIHTDLADAFIAVARWHKPKPQSYQGFLDAFLSKGVGVNVIGQFECGELITTTALHEAARMNNISLARFLLSIENIDVNVQANDRTPLEVALLYPRVEVAIMIIETGKVNKDLLKTTGDFLTSCSLKHLTAYDRIYQAFLKVSKSSD